ncbi:MAG: 23S rRNA (adenine(2503)-C(2))-methyltransferase RlmN [Elusimicrobiota bacterium]
MLPHIKDLGKSQLLSFLEKIGEKPFRMRQLMIWLYRKRVNSFDEMTNISKSFRCVLKENFVLKKLKIGQILRSRDGTVKFAFFLEDGEIIESVIIPDGKRTTACLSSQVGCGLGCSFCATARIGFRRNLKIGEITGQLAALNDYLAPQKNKISHIVFMGMGEPLLNFKNVMAALEYITDDLGFIISPHKITISTAGIVPGIRRLAENRIKTVLAVSLNSADDNLRKKLMPVARKYSLPDIIKAARYYFLKTGEKVTFEYLMIKDQNMDNQQRQKIMKIIQGDYCKFNFIPYNPIGTEDEFLKPNQDQIDLFLKPLFSLPVVVTLRKSRGADIGAACGMLRGRLKIN